MSCTKWHRRGWIKEISKHQAEVEAREMKRRQRLMEIKLKQEKMMIKLKKQTADFVRQQEIQAKAKAKKRFEEKVKFLNTRFVEMPKIHTVGCKAKKSRLPRDLRTSLEELHMLGFLIHHTQHYDLCKTRRPNSSIYKGLMHRIDVNASPFRIGRGSQCDVRMDSRLNSGLISKVHCAFLQVSIASYTCGNSIADLQHKWYFFNLGRGHSRLRQ